MASRPERGGTRAWTLALLALGVALAVLSTRRWRLPEPAADMRNAAAVPCWMMLGPIQTMTEDGSLLRLRLALDACDAGSQAAINAGRRELEMLVRVEVAARSRPELEGAGGIQRLREVLKLRLSEHVQGVGAVAVRDLVIDQFVLRRVLGGN